jgi:lysophospholipase L1-like esterase
LKRFALLAVAALVLSGCAAEQAPVPASVQSYYDEHVANAKATLPATAAPAVAPVIVSILSDSHAFNAGSWFRSTVEAGTVLGVKLGAFASQPGASASVLAAKLDEATEKKGVVIVQAGTNDLLSALGSDQTAINIEALAEGVKARGAKPVLALLPPSAKRGPEVLATNKLLTAYAATHQIGLLDLTTTVATPDGQWKDGLSDDGTHANAAGAKIMAEAAAQQLPALLR